ncbi:MAG: transposase [Candidatus Reddybacter sp.]
MINFRHLLERRKLGMKMHIGVDLRVVRNIAATSADVHDITQADNLLHGQEECVWSDTGYRKA